MWKIKYCCLDIYHIPKKCFNMVPMEGNGAQILIHSKSTNFATETLSVLWIVKWVSGPIGLYVPTAAASL